MLQEVLFALSGHPSPLFKFRLEGQQLVNDTKIVNQDFPDLDPSEAALLESVGRLALIHSRLRSDLKTINTSYSSTICRAVAASLLHTHLARFQKKILDVERQILTKDASIVGAYNIVPLSGIVGEFDDWHRRMQWYAQLAAFIQRVPSSNKSSNDTPHQSTGAALIDHLRLECQTGYPDIEAVATELSRVAETAWLKQLSTWILHGRLPQHGAEDFFVALDPAKDVQGHDVFILKRQLLPTLVSTTTASSLLFVGKSLYQLRQYRSADSRMSEVTGIDETALASAHLRMLSTLSLPLVPATLSRTVASIRVSISRNILQRLLPMDDIIKTLSMFRDYFLFRRGDFATTLIEKAESLLLSRQASLGNLLQGGSSNNLRNMVLKEGEISEALAQTWKTILGGSVNDDEDQSIEHARECIRLEITSRRLGTPLAGTNKVVISHVAFDDLLFPVKTTLTMRPSPPLDLFISPTDIAQYSSLSAYLLALRRAHVRLSNLWRLSAARREISKEQRTHDEARKRTAARSASLRKVWATCSSALFLLSETSAYFEGEIVLGSWTHFYDWATQGKTTQSNREEPNTAATTCLEASMQSTLISSTTELPTSQQHDPETLSLSHRAFLSSLAYALLLTDVPNTLALRTLLTSLDNLIAHFTRLHHIRQALDLEGADAVTFSTTEEQETELELDRARKRTDSAMKDVVARLRVLDRERVGKERYMRVEGDEIAMMGGFVPWQGGGVERLLMKLDFGRLSDVEILDGYGD